MPAWERHHTIKIALVLRRSRKIVVMVPHNACTEQLALIRGVERVGKEVQSRPGFLSNATRIDFGCHVFCIGFGI